MLGKLQTPGAQYILLIVVRGSYNGINAVEKKKKYVGKST